MGVVTNSNKYTSSTGICAGSITDLVNAGVASLNLGDWSRSTNDFSVQLNHGSSDESFYINILENAFDNNLYLYKITAKGNYKIERDDLASFALRLGTELTDPVGDYKTIQNFAFNTSSSRSGSFTESVPSVDKSGTTSTFGFGAVSQSLADANDKKASVTGLSLDLHYGYKLSYSSTLYYGTHRAGSLSVSSQNSGDYTTSNLSGSNICKVGGKIKIAVTPSDGYYIKNWTDGTAGSSIASPDQTRSNISVTQSGDLPVKPNLVPYDYAINYSCALEKKAGGFTITSNFKDHSNKTTYNVTMNNFSLVDPNKKYGYKFVGWIDNTEGDATVSLDAASTSMTVATTTNLKTKKYIAVYKIEYFNITYLYEDSYGVSDYPIENLGRYNELKRTYTVEDTNLAYYTSTILTRDGYEMKGYRYQDEIDFMTKTPAEKQLEGVTLVVFLAHLKLHVTATPILYEGYDSLDWWNKDNEKERPQVLVKNTYINAIEEVKQGMDIIINYKDNYNYVQLEVLEGYNPKIFEFLGWYIKDTNTLVSRDLIVSGRNLSYKSNENKYEARFRVINYTYIIQMYNDKESHPQICGDLLTSKGAENETIEYDEQNGTISLKNLTFGETRDIAIIPYARNNVEGYFFEKWATKNKNSVLQISVDNGWYGDTTTKTIYFVTKKLNENTVNKDNDTEKTAELLGKTISEFIVVEDSKISTLREYGFYNCSNLEYLYMPTCFEVGNNTFEGCSNLKNVTISSSQQGPTIGVDTFKNCNNLTLLVLPGQFVALGSVFAEGDKPDANIELKEGETIADYQSLFMKNLGKIYVPEDLYDRYIEADNWHFYNKAFCKIPNNEVCNIYKGAFFKSN